MNKTTNTLIATGVVALLIILCAIAWYKTGNKPKANSGETVEESVAVAGDEKGQHGGRFEPYRVCRRVNILRDYADDKIKIYP